MIYDSYVHSYLSNRYREQLGNMSIDLTALFSKLDFVITTKTGQNFKYPNFSEIRYPAIGQDWLKRYQYSQQITDLFDKEENPDVEYRYKFEQIDQDLFSYFYYWLLSFVDSEARMLFDTYVVRIEDILKFVAKSVTDKSSLNLYIDLWINIIDEIVQRNNTFLINNVRFGDYINKPDYLFVKAILTGNKN